MLSPEPPYKKEDPEDEDEEKNVPDPATALSVSHIVQSCKSPRQNS